MEGLCLFKSFLLVILRIAENRAENVWDYPGNYTEQHGTTRNCNVLRSKGKIAVDLMN
jgi:hypothetical protein